MEDDTPALLGGVPVCRSGPPCWPLEDPAIASVLTELAVTGAWGRYHGPWCDRLAEAIRTIVHTKHVLPCSSGTVAMELALRGLGVRPGDEVLLAAYDYKSNFSTVLLLGARPVLVDVGSEDAQLSVDQLEQARTSQTRAVIVSHLHGGCVDLQGVQEWASRSGVAVVEDACQAPGAVIQGKPAGGGGDVGIWSFGGSKLLTAGRGGAVLTNRDDVAQRIRLYTQRGNDAYPLSEMQAAVLIPQLEQLSLRHHQRHQAVVQLDALLSNEPGLLRLRNFSDCDPAFYKVGFWYEPTFFGGLSRDQFARAMRQEGVACDPGFSALHRVHARSRFVASGHLNNASRAHELLLILHHPVLLQEQNCLEEIVRGIRKIRTHAEALKQQIFRC